MSRRTRSLIVWGTSSGAGKSWLATALCRSAARRGIDAAPFKAQNMSNNARVVARDDGGLGEIGSAQYFQALAARAVPGTAMNPVLLKPERDTTSQVVVHGRVRRELGAMPWRERSDVLAVAARESFEALAARHELIVIEGAGSPAEINLAAHDYVNLGTARWAMAAGPTRALLVSDIDRGGSFAHLYGTWRLLPDDLRGLLTGFVLNKFRGDPALLAPGPAELQALTGVPLAGVLPMRRDHGLPEEDGLFDDAPTGFAAPGTTLRVAVVAGPHISNLDEFAPLRRVPGLRLRWARSAPALEGADWIVLPGSKQVSGDLAWLRQGGMADAVLRHALAGGAVLGICGGLQMLGERLDDPEGHDGEPVNGLPGLGLLPLRTVHGPRKLLDAGAMLFGAVHGAWQGLSGLPLAGYQIRHGRTQATAAAVVPVLSDAAGSPIGWQAGPVLGLAAHGLFENAAVLQAFFGASVPTLDSAFDTVADLLDEHLDPAMWPALLGQ